MALEIRPVEATDVPTLLALVTRVLGEFGLDFGNSTDEQLKHLPGSYAEHGGAFWIATCDGALLGTCGVFPVDGATMELRKMYLEPASRGLGIGGRLLELAVAWSRERGASKLVLDTTAAMTRAIAFYEANGFVRDDAQIRGARCNRGYSLTLAPRSAE